MKRPLRLVICVTRIGDHCLWSSWAILNCLETDSKYPFHWQRIFLSSKNSSNSHFFLFNNFLDWHFCFQFFKIKNASDLTWNIVKFHPGAVPKNGISAQFQVPLKFRANASRLYSHKLCIGIVLKQVFREWERIHKVFSNCFLKEFNSFSTCAKYIFFL